MSPRESTGDASEVHHRHFRAFDPAFVKRLCLNGLPRSRWTMLLWTRRRTIHRPWRGPLHRPWRRAVLWSRRWPFDRPWGWTVLWSRRWAFDRPWGWTVLRSRRWAFDRHWGWTVLRSRRWAFQRPQQLAPAELIRHCQWNDLWGHPVGRSGRRIRRTIEIVERLGPSTCWRPVGDRTAGGPSRLENSRKAAV